MKRFMEDPQFQPFRVAILAIIAIVLGWLVITPAHGQNARNKMFPLGKPFIATVAICATEEYARSVADDEGKSVFDVYRAFGSCAGGETRVTYLRHIYTSKLGYSVYEVEISGHKVFAITDWRADSI